MKRLITTLAIATAMLAISAATASADTLISSQSNYEVSGGPSTQVTVSASYSIADFDGNASLAQFVVEAWDLSCDPDDFYGNFGDDSQFTVPDQADGSASATFNVYKQTHYCVGTYFSVDGTALLIAQPLYFDEARIEFLSDYAYSHSLGFSLSVDPGGLGTVYWFKYFKKVNTDQCNMPDEDDLETALTTIPIWVGTEPMVGTYDTIDGLELETQYCVAFIAQNVTGTTSENYYGYETTGDVPTIANQSFKPSTSRIDFSADITPNSAHSNAHLEVQYFAKNGDGTCDEYEGTPETFSYYGPGGNSPTGFETTNMSSSIDDVDPGTYCIRVLGINDYGAGGSGTWRMITMASKAPASAEAVKFKGTKLSFVLDDRGAFFDTRNYGVAGVTLFQTNPEYCNDDFYAAGTEMLTSNFFFGDASEYLYDIDDLVPGQNYCFHAFLGSTWGEEFDSTYSQNIVFGLAPVFSDVNTSHTTTSIKIDANLNPGSLETGFSGHYFAKDEDEACEDHDGGDYAGGGNLTEDLGQAAPVSVEVSELAPDTDYCLRLVAENSAGDESTAFHVVHTDPDTEDPSKPTELAASNITKTSATLIWDAATDNVDVAGYLVFKDGDELTDTAGTSTQVSLACGEASSFVVQAFDSAGNYSDDSDALVITGAVCDPDAPSAPTGLVASNVTQTSATLSWTAATDNVGVTGYKVYKNIVFVGDASGTSTTVSVTCGTSALFAVKAIDAAGNLSAASMPVQIIGAPCDVPAPPAGSGGGSPPAARSCLAPIKAVSASGKFKKGRKKVKYSVKLSGAVAADGQSALVTVKDDGVTATFKVDGKSAKAKKGAITVQNNPSLVTVSFKAGSVTKTLKLKLAQVTC